MSMDPNAPQHSQQTDLDAQLKERFSQLPKVVQDAIISADVDAHLRKLADTHRLHLDEWQKLENEVMLALLGFEHVEDLQKNVEQEIGLPSETARALIADVNTIVFEPIRQELERGLTHPEAVQAAQSGVEAVGAQEMKTAQGEQTAPQPTAPTPPVPVPNVKVTRPSQSTEYRPGEASTARASVVDDPYREPPL